MADEPEPLLRHLCHLIGDEGAWKPVLGCPGLRRQCSVEKPDTWIIRFRFLLGKQRLRVSRGRCADQDFIDDSSACGGPDP